jgi:hypothetical protein
LEIRASSFVCSTSGSLVDADAATLSGVAVWGWGGVNNPLLRVSQLDASFSTFGLAEEAVLVSEAARGEMRDSLVGGPLLPRTTSVRFARVRHAPGTTSPPDGSVEADPLFWGASRPDDCENVTLYPDRGSPLIDTGNPSLTDRDGSRADIGSTGGPDGIMLVLDDDGDRCPQPFDCDDTQTDTRPGNPEIWYDGRDQDCAGGDDLDQDGDGDRRPLDGGTDCDDTRADVAPDLADPCYDGLDQDCDGFDGLDCDGDGEASADQGGRDCADDDATIGPAAVEDVGPIDRDCDGLRDPEVEVEPLTCGTSPSGGAPVSLLLAVLVLLRRRGTC